MTLTRPVDDQGCPARPSPIYMPALFPRPSLPAITALAQRAEAARSSDYPLYGLAVVGVEVGGGCSRGGRWMLERDPVELGDNRHSQAG